MASIQARQVRQRDCTPRRFEVAAPPVLSGPPSSTFATRPSFSWTNLATTFNGQPAGVATYEFRLEGIDPATHQYTPLYTVTGLTSTSYTVANPLPVGNYRAYVAGIANGRPASGIAETRTDFSFPVEFFVGGRPVVIPIPASDNRTPTIRWQPANIAFGFGRSVPVEARRACGAIRLRS